MGKYPHIKKVDSTDIYAVIGLIYLRGLYGLTKHTIFHPFSDKEEFQIWRYTVFSTLYLHHATYTF